MEKNLSKWNRIILSPIDNMGLLGTVPAMSREEVDEAMKSARAALKAWRIKAL